MYIYKCVNSKFFVWLLLPRIQWTSFAFLQARNRGAHFPHVPAISPVGFDVQHFRFSFILPEKKLEDKLYEFQNVRQQESGKYISYQCPSVETRTARAALEKWLRDAIYICWWEGKMKAAPNRLLRGNRLLKGLIWLPKRIWEQVVFFWRRCWVWSREKATKILPPQSMTRYL